MFDWITRLRFRWMVHKRLCNVISKVRRNGSDFTMRDDRSPVLERVSIEISGSVHINATRIMYGSIPFAGIEKGTEILLYRHLPEIEIAVDALNSNTKSRGGSELEFMRKALEIEGKTPADELLRAVDAK